MITKAKAAGSSRLSKESRLSRMNDNRVYEVEQEIQRKVDRYSAGVDTMERPKRCAGCKRGSGRALKWHGSYTRRLITMMRIHTIRIRRISCDECGVTFGVIPEFVEKFHHYGKGVIVFAIRALRALTYERVADLFESGKESCIALLTLHRWRRSFA